MPDMYGRDIRAFEDGASSVETVEGLDNLKQAILSLCVSSLGGLVYRPAYGIALEIDALGTPAAFAAAASSLREAILRDGRVQSVRVTVGEASPGVVVADVLYRPTGSDVPQMVRSRL